MATRWTRAVSVFASLGLALVTAAGIAVYLHQSRPQADRLLAHRAIDALEGVSGSAEATASDEMFSEALFAAAPEVNLLLMSDTAERHPEIADQVRRAEDLYTLAFEIARFERQGELSPRTEALGLTPEAVLEMPGIDDLVVGAGTSGMRIDNSGGQAVAALKRAAGRAVAEARSAFDERESGGWR